MNLDNINEPQTTALTTLQRSPAVDSHNTAPEYQDLHVVQSYVSEQQNLSENELLFQHISNTESGYTTLLSADAFNVSQPIGITVLQYPSVDLNSVENLLQNEGIEPPTTVLEGQSLASSSFEDRHGANVTSSSETVDDENQAADAMEQSLLERLTDLYDDFIETSTNLSASSLISLDEFLRDFISKSRSGNNSISLGRDEARALIVERDEARALIVERWETESSFSLMSTSEMSDEDLEFFQEESERSFAIEGGREPQENPEGTPRELQGACEKTEVAENAYLMCESVEAESASELGIKPNILKTLQDANPPEHLALLFGRHVPGPFSLQPSSDELDAQVSQEILHPLTHENSVLVSTSALNRDPMMCPFSGHSAQCLTQAAESVKGCVPVAELARPGNNDTSDEVLPQVEAFGSVVNGHVPLVEAIEESNQVQLADIPLQDRRPMVTENSFDNADQLPFPQPDDFDIAIDLRRGHDFFYVARCVACVTRRPNVMNLPCRHSTFCTTCTSPGQNCPTCNYPIRSYEHC